MQIDINKITKLKSTYLSSSRLKLVFVQLVNVQIESVQIESVQLLDVQCTCMIVDVELVFASETELLLMKLIVVEGDYLLKVFAAEGVRV
ncbi:hypothetical protein CTI12_AA138900 [Artemisia annua]|uniref:Uncharacterized protein n=1 Tax=Artemisia annua TaxID=35608 RepID=A0A2U1PLE5_ARTAN|nr:hypothetical protein CTI12_AA138900 [Artemisia annua]